MILDIKIQVSAQAEYADGRPRGPVFTMEFSQSTRIHIVQMFQEVQKQVDWEAVRLKSEKTKVAAVQRRTTFEDVTKVFHEKL
jgi:hypothetical protein